MKFYSQWGEDKALLSLFKDQHEGYFVEVGAADGIRGSNTYLFELLGWKGICIEPDRDLFPHLSVNRPDSICLDVAVWDENAETSNFYVTECKSSSRIGEPPSQEILAKLGHWTLEKWQRKFPEKVYKYSTHVQHPKLRTLDYILKENKAPVRFDLLSIDVERTECHTLKGFSLGHYMPRIVIIEDHFPFEFESYFREFNYTPVRREKYQKRRGKWRFWKRYWSIPRNTIYFRDYEDAEVVKKVWEGL